MITLTDFKKKYNISKIKYIEKWIDNGLIPGVKIRNGEYLVPDSARRPYKDRGLNANTNADKVRAHIVKACIQRRHVSPEICYMTEGEFDVLVSELKRAGLIAERVEDNIRYFDSTMVSQAWMNKRINQISSLIAPYLAAISEGVTAAMIRNN